VLDTPALSAGYEGSRDEVLHFVRFTIDYLRKMRLLDGEGRPLNLASLVCRLYYQTPGNFVLAALLQSGELHNLVADLDASNEKAPVLLALCSVLARLFARRYLPRSVQRTDDNVKQSSSKVFLEPLPDKIAAAVKAHQDLLLQIFSSYVRTFAKQRTGQAVDDTLPFSGIRPFDGQASAPLAALLKPTAIPYAARSPFIAVSGKGDTFGSVKEIGATVRGSIHVWSL
jgi:hypothetical protein